ncbi:hypothetical protein F5Y16DRAFT_422758 [Xylariaceae sp. FL0255]|nr:hypothetical protein F5Y16DRAFT_422758 [Xylariaceae sp. FL0255]
MGHTKLTPPSRAPLPVAQRRGDRKREQNITIKYPPRFMDHLYARPSDINDPETPLRIPAFLARAFGHDDTIEKATDLSENKSNTASYAQRKKTRPSRNRGAILLTRQPRGRRGRCYSWDHESDSELDYEPLASKISCEDNKKAGNQWYDDDHIVGFGTLSAHRNDNRQQVHPKQSSLPKHQSRPTLRAHHVRADSTASRSKTQHSPILPNRLDGPSILETKWRNHHKT